jgi:mannose-6-phosphate isomerase-like protein (cupin superfamily)
MDSRRQQTEVEYLIGMDNMESFYDEPGERGWILEGEKHGFANTSVIITETAPLGGPPLHTHKSEEVHIVPRARLAYVIGDSYFEIEGPCAIRIPAGVAHTFLNLSPEPTRIVCFFPHNSFWSNYDELGPNPLLEKYGVVQRQE